MPRLDLIIVTIIAIAWLVIPIPMTGGGLLGFEEQDESADAGAVTTIYKFGWPLTWMTYEQEWDKGLDRGALKMESFDRWNLYLHIAVIAIPAFFLIRAMLKAKQDAAKETTKLLG
jgi:hypothetical protein